MFLEPIENSEVLVPPYKEPRVSLLFCYFMHYKILDSDRLREVQVENSGPYYCTCSQMIVEFCGYYLETFVQVKLCENNKI